MIYSKLPKIGKPFHDRLRLVTSATTPNPMNDNVAVTGSGTAKGELNGTATTCGREYLSPYWKTTSVMCDAGLNPCGTPLLNVKENTTEWLTMGLAWTDIVPLVSVVLADTKP